MAVVKGTVSNAVNEHKCRVRSRPRLRPPAGGAYREAKVEFGHKLSDGNLVFGHPHYQTVRTTQPGGSDSSGRPHWLQGKPHRVSLKSIRYPRMERVAYCLGPSHGHVHLLSNHLVTFCSGPCHDRVRLWSMSHIIAQTHRMWSRPRNYGACRVCSDPSHGHIPLSKMSHFAEAHSIVASR